jgi:DNA-binding CsgD family transcriptional regulator
MAKNGRGHIYTPTKKQREEVEKYSSLGITQAEICAILDIDTKTFRKHLDKEFKKGKAKANATVASRLFNKTKDDTTAMIFWLKTQARWSEKVEHVIDMPSTVFQFLKRDDGDK